MRGGGKVDVRAGGAPGNAGNCSVQGSVGKGQPGHPPDFPTGAVNAGAVRADGVACGAGLDTAIVTGAAAGAGSGFFFAACSSFHFAARLRPSSC